MISKSRYASIDSYLSPCGERYNDIKLVMDEDIYKKLRDNGELHVYVCVRVYVCVYMCVHVCLLGQMLIFCLDDFVISFLSKLQPFMYWGSYTKFGAWEHLILPINNK